MYIFINYRYNIKQGLISQRSTCEGHVEKFRSAARAIKNFRGTMKMCKLLLIILFYFLP